MSDGLTLYWHCMISVFVNIANTAGNTLTNQLCVNTEDGWKSLDHRNIIPTE